MAIYQLDKDAAIAGDGTRKQKEYWIMKSTDTKPTDCGAGSMIWESNTDTYYRFDGADWVETAL